LTMTAPIELSLFSYFLFRRHTPQLCEHHLTQGRPDRRKLSNSVASQHREDKSRRATRAMRGFFPVERGRHGEHLEQRNREAA
jgi:hypothetical protein